MTMTGPELKAWRKYLGITQADLAEKLEIHRRTIQTWEHLDEVPLLTRLALAAMEKRLMPLGGW